MRIISKGKEPDSLIAHRLRPHSDFENYIDKDGLRTALYVEQRGLCCYCLSRIRPNHTRMKIEHWHSQSRYPSEQLDYSNLLGACVGGEGDAWRGQHCDTRKGDQELSRNPANKLHRVVDLMRFRGDGRVYSDDQTFDREIDDVLNLNTPRLRENRKAVLDAFVRALPKSGSLAPAKLSKWLNEWQGDTYSGELREFCQIVIYWLRKKISRS